MCSFIDVDSNKTVEGCVDLAASVVEVVDCRKEMLPAFVFELFISTSTGVVSVEGEKGRPFYMCNIFRAILALLMSTIRSWVGCHPAIVFVEGTLFLRRG